MPEFTYKLVNKENRLIGGTIKAISKRKARKTLEKNDSTVLFLVPAKNTRFSFRSLPIFNKFSAIERISFFRNLASMVSSGISAVEALRVIQDQTQNKRIKKVMTEMITNIENGEKLTSAMKKAPKNFFSEFLIEAVNIGSVSGKLTDILDRIADDLQYEHDLRKKVFASLAYPAIVICVMIIVTLMMMIYVLPQIAVLFQELNTPLPFVTRALLATSAFVQKYYYLIVGAIILLVVAFIVLNKNKKTRYYIHYIYLKIPIFGKMIKETNLALFFRSLEALFSAGISLLRSVEISEKTVKNEVYQKTLMSMNPILVYGTNFSEALKPFPFLFPLQLQKMVEVGEKTGKLEESFKRLNSYYDRIVRYKAETLSTIIEPVILVIAGVGVGIIALSIFMPIYQSTQVL